MLKRLSLGIFLVCVAASLAESDIGNVWLEDKVLNEKIHEDFHKKVASASEKHVVDNLHKKRTVDDDLDELQAEIYVLQAELEDVMAGLHKQDMDIQALTNLYETATVRYCWAGTMSVCHKSTIYCCTNDYDDCEVISFRADLYYNFHMLPSVFVYLQNHDRNIEGSSYKLYYQDLSNRYLTMVFEPSKQDTKYQELWIGFMGCA